MRAAGWADIYDWQVDRAAAMPLFRQIYQQVSRGILDAQYVFPSI
jgi:hypothetical protein